MKLRQLFTINLFFAVFFGVSCAVFPDLTAWMYGLISDESTIWVTRLAGGSILGFATLMWFGRSVAPLNARKAIAMALLVQDAIGCIASVEFQLTGKVNAFGWFTIALYGALALAYAYFLFLRPNDC